VHEAAWAALEPGTAHPMQRLRAVRELRRAGVNAGVLMAPVVPGFTTQPARLEATIKAIADHGAAFMGANILHLKGGTRDHFLHFVSKEFPERLDGYRRMYPGAYAPKDYTDTVRGLIKTLRERYNVGRRATENPAPSDPETADVDESTDPEQGTFVWG
jgi:DNA repair photolyase